MGIGVGNATEKVVAARNVVEILAGRQNDAGCVGRDQRRRVRCAQATNATERRQGRVTKSSSIGAGSRTRSRVKANVPSATHDITGRTITFE
jgi:hypothetical protein